jgi:hypothetical protein
MDSLAVQQMESVWGQVLALQTEGGLRGLSPFPNAEPEAGEATG